MKTKENWSEHTFSSVGPFGSGAFSMTFCRMSFVKIAESGEHAVLNVVKASPYT